MARKLTKENLLSPTKIVSPHQRKLSAQKRKKSYMLMNLKELSKE